MKKMSFLLFVLIAFCNLIIAREKFVNNIIPVSPSNFKVIDLTEEQSFELLKSDEAYEVINLRNSFLDKIKYAVESGKSISYLKIAAEQSIKSNNPVEIYTAIFGSKGNGDIFIAKMKEANKKFNDKFKLLTQSTGTDCKECNQFDVKEIVLFFDNFEVINRNKISSIPRDAVFGTYRVAGGGPCGGFWGTIKVMGCATACSLATAGIGTGLCGLACWCRYCPNSELAGIIC
jgi:hypothetical protein